MPEGKLVQDGSRERIASHAPVRCRGDLDNRPVGQLDALAGLAGHHPAQHRIRVDQADDVAHYRPGLPPVRGNAHDGGNLARRELGPMVPEERLERRQQGRCMALAAATAHCQPQFGEAAHGRAGRLSGGQLLEGLAIGADAVEAAQERAPCGPALAAELVAEQAAIRHGVDDVSHRPAPSAQCRRQESGSRPSPSVPGQGL